MLSQANISPTTPMGANLVAGGGVTFRLWAPRATAVYLNGSFGGTWESGQSDDLLMAKDPNGSWTGFVANAKDSDPYHYFVVGTGSSGYKRDPYAREMATDQPFPICACLVRSSDAYPWHDAQFVTPDYSDMIIYQLHIGTYAPSASGKASTFLDVIGKVEYLAALGINVLQPLPVDEMETNVSMGYNGADLFSPDFPFVVTDPNALNGYLGNINRMLANQGCAALSFNDISTGPAQLRAMVDLCHLYGIAVIFDVVYNHAGGFEGDDQGIFFGDRADDPFNMNQSLYFTDQSTAGGLAFALWNDGVRQFLVNNASYYIQEFHADGFRCDEISALLSMNQDSGWTFCCDFTNTVHYLKPRLLLNAEYWEGDNQNYYRPTWQILTPTDWGGTGFNVVQHAGLRDSVRAAVAQASQGQGAGVDLDSVAGNLYPQGVGHGWMGVTCVENHDLVAVGRQPRLPVLGDGSNSRSWYARSRARWATGVLLTSPGMPHIFMGQEFLEDKQWNWDPTSPNLIWWGGVDGADQAMVNHLRFTQDLIRLRWNQPALRGDNVNPFHVHDQNRVIAYHRWLDSGEDVIVVATLSDSTWWGYGIGFPGGGFWKEVFNSDVYDNWVNPQVAGNGGGVWASGPGMDGFGQSANVVIPGNGVVVFARG